MRLFPLSLLLLAVTLVAAACQPVVCNAPYLQVGQECCLDRDGNKVCDKDESAEGETQIIVTGTQPDPVEVKTYVCPDGSEVEDKADCVLPDVEEPKPAPPPTTLPELVTTNEQGTAIKSVTVQPACISGVNGGQVHFEVDTVPDSTVFEVKEQGQGYETAYTRDSQVYSAYTPFVICDSCFRGEFQLKPGKLYVFRILFGQESLYGEKQYSNEHLIDTREGSEYMSKLCSK